MPTLKPLVMPCKICSQSDSSPYLQRSNLVLFTSRGVIMQCGSGPHPAGFSSMGRPPADAASMVVDTCSSKGAKGIPGPSEAENLVVQSKQGMLALGISTGKWKCWMPG